MIKNKIYSFAVLFSTVLFAQVPTVVDTVMVPVKIVKLNSITGTGDSAVYDYSGKVTYNLKVGDNDSLNTTLDFVPVGGGNPVTPYEVTGDVGIRSFVNGINGQNEIYFKLKIFGTPAASYTARITINADKSSIEKIVDSLLALMTIQEKVDQLHGTGEGGKRIGPDNKRLMIPGYYASNGPLGVGRGADERVGGTATSFPAPCALGNTWDTAIVYQLGVALGKEYWAKACYICEAPMVNMVRDPRSGRNFETFSEDPYLCALLGVSYCKGVQSSNCVAMPKHYVCNEAETNRKTNSSDVPERTLREIYAMPFEYCVREAKAWSIMSAQNGLRILPEQAGLMVQSQPPWSAENSLILQKLLKDEWGFRGFVMSDWMAIRHTAEAANAGEDIELNFSAYFGQTLLSAVQTNQVSQNRLNDMVKRLLRTKVWADVIGKLGDAAVIKYISDLKSPATEALCRTIAQKSIVVVKNEKFNTSDPAPVLPLDNNALTSVAVVGPNFANLGRPAGNIGSGTPSPYYNITPLQGITEKVGAGKITTNWQGADVVICVLGTSGEREGGDRTTVTLEPPSGQIAQINEILAAGKKCVVVITGGSACIKDKWFDAPAVVIAWFPGEEQGNALADVLFGDVNPSGKLSSSFPVSESQLPPFINQIGTDVAYEAPDEGRGYRYYDKHAIEPLLPFGFGLSYTTFEYSNLRMSPNPAYIGENVTVTVTITNTGNRAGEEVAQLYIHETAPKLPRPVKELRGFARIALDPGESKDASFTLRERELAYFDDSQNVKRFVCQPDNYDIMVGPSSKTLPLTGTLVMQSPY